MRVPKQSPQHARTSISGGTPSALLNRLLVARGLTDAAEIAGFLEPKLTHLLDPSLIPDLDKAAQRLIDAARAGEPIVIYGDYDVDGITASAILFHTLCEIAPQGGREAGTQPAVSTYVPHRIEEGYGLNSEAIGELARTGARVIVSVDCGVTAVEPARVARELGIDLIITDHHNPPATLAELPEAFAVVHPRRADSRYPFEWLSGAGVAYKLAWRIATLAHGSERVPPAMRALLVDLLAFAALGTIADIVPLVGENRVLARFGLVRARHSRFVGLRALVEAAGLTDEAIGEMEVGFRLGPRLNAAGRMGHAKQAVELFTLADTHRAREIAVELSAQNESRRKVEQAILEQAVQRAQDAGMTGPDARAIVLADDRWHPGVVGIVCSRLVERFHRPTILMQSHDGVCHGSARSVAGFNMHAGLLACAEHLDRFGGHDMAAGLHLVEPKLAAFTRAFTDHANALIAPDDLRPLIEIDCEASADELTLEATSELERFAPFGAGNPPVRVLVRDLVVDRFKAMGANAKHASIQLRSLAHGADHPERVFRCVAWGWGEHEHRLCAGTRLDAVLTPKVSTFSGSPKVEPEIKDVRISS